MSVEEDYLDHGRTRKCYRTVRPRWVEPCPQCRAVNREQRAKERARERIIRDLDRIPLEGLRAAIESLKELDDEA